MLNKNGFTVQFPEGVSGLNQDVEYIVLIKNGVKRRIRFHDYHEIFSVPGLYEYLFHEKLKCTSPDVISTMLVDEVEKDNFGKEKLKVMDVGAGNGLVGEVLLKKGIKKMVGIDILPEASKAAKRDRPHVYEKYFVEDLTKLPLGVIEAVWNILKNAMPPPWIFQRRDSQHIRQGR